ncbi:hypothetical protein MASR1M48_17010 [Lactococcus petauri]
MSEEKEPTVKMTLKEMITQGKNLFGEDRDKWVFVCPICKKEQTNEDFKSKGTDGLETGLLGFSCIGRLAEDPYRGFGSGKGDKSQGCDYSSGGFFVINKKFAIGEDGKEIPVFKFKGE